MRNLLVALLLVGCSSSDDAVSPSTSTDSGVITHDDGSGDVDSSSSADTTTPCSTTITYGSAWIHASGHPDSFDLVAGDVSWGGVCTDDGVNSYATLSNGFKPYFQGNGGCILALDHAASCGTAPGCATSITYGPAWLHPPSHPDQFDQVAGRVFSDGMCHLSNGWAPAFQGACRLSFEYTECGGLYENPVIPFDCPDPGVIADGVQYVLTCTSGNAPDAFPIFTSSDLAHWAPQGHVFPSGKRPAWAMSDFWAPEIHNVGSHYVAYFSARGKDGVLSVGAASAPSATGPFTDIGGPLVHDPSMGLIDASEITAPTPYLLWKEDGNAVGKQTPIHAQRLAPDGLSLTGTPSTLITNDLGWEGSLVEGPFMIAHAGSFYLFYSGNAYDTASYAIGVAKGASPLGPFTKAGPPILVSSGAWAGPGHCSVVDTPAGDTYMIYHAWKSTAVGSAPGRQVLTDAVTWNGGWPSVPLGPSSTTRPLP